MSNSTYHDTIAAAPSAPRSLSLRRIGHHAVTAMLFLGGLVMVFPFIWMISSSLKPKSEIFGSNFSLWPREFYGFINYGKVLFDQPYLLYIANSLIVCLGILLVQLATAIPAAYALAKLRFKGSSILFGAVIAGITIPVNVTAIPLYVGIVKVGLLDTYLAMMFPFFVSVFAIFLFRQFFRSFPDSIIQAARIDGFSEME